MYGLWRILKTGVQTFEGKKKDRIAYQNALCLCTKCNETEKIIAYPTLAKCNDNTGCNRCAGFEGKTTEEYINDLKAKVPKAKLKDGEIYINSIVKLKHICSMCGEDYDGLPTTILSHGQHTCKKCSFIVSSNRKRWTTEEYIKNLLERNPIVKLKEGERYLGGDAKIKHICSRCHKDWSVPPGKVLAGHTMCKKCAITLTESTHATVVKQVYKHHYKQAIWEGNVTVDNKQYDIDIVNHDKREAVEIDGHQHKKITIWHKQQAKKNKTTPEYEFEQQQIRDKNIDIYFEKIGYKLIRIDIENITPLQALQSIFPEYDKIPNWVDLSGKPTKLTWDVEKAQEMLNQYKTNTEIYKELGVHYSTISTYMKDGRLIKPKGYKTHVEIKWDIEKAQELLNQYKTYQEIADILNVSRSVITNAVNTSKKLKQPKDYLENSGVRLAQKQWISNVQNLLNEGFSYKEVAEKLNIKYKTILDEVSRGNIKRPENYVANKGQKPVVQLGLKHNIIKEYCSASNIDGFKVWMISDACNGKYSKNYNGHFAKGYLWYFKSDYKPLENK